MWDTSIKLLKLPFFLLKISTLFALDIDQVCLWDNVKYFDSLIFVIVSQCSEEARFRRNQVDPINMIIDLIICNLSDDFGSS
jgi:hypothetical protein